jgi:mannose-6-phosphate isomerase-like protein (cupin superfamily)
MSDYSVTNLKEVDDSAAGRGMDIEARMARKHLDSRELGVSYFRYGAGVRASYGHHHKEQEEAYVVISGSGRARLGDEFVDLRQFDVLRVSPEVIRGFESGPDVIAVGGSRPEGGDGVMVQDWWPN